MPTIQAAGWPMSTHESVAARRAGDPERGQPRDETRNRPQLAGLRGRDVEIASDLGEDGRERDRAGLSCEEAEEEDGADRSVPALSGRRGHAFVTERALDARWATSAATSAHRAPIRMARWKPAVRACGRPPPEPRTVPVRSVATAERTASPDAPPNCIEAFKSPEAMPAWSAGTPSVAAVVTPVKTAPAPRATRAMPGSRSPRKAPSTGTCERR